MHSFLHSNAPAAARGTKRKRGMAAIDRAKEVEKNLPKIDFGELGAVFLDAMKEDPVEKKQRLVSPISA
jgi:hypothetical protein